MKSHSIIKNVSIILPLFNEESNIENLIIEIYRELNRINFESEIIIVDDSSTDNSNAKAKQVLKKLDMQHQIIFKKKRIGLAQSILLGIKKSTFNNIIVMDTDHTHSPTDLPKLLHQVKFFDVVVASRFCYGGNMENQRLYYSSYLLNLMIRVLSRTQLQDNTGGFFLGKKDKLENLLTDKVFYGFGEYFIRFVKLCQNQSLNILEIPTVYKNRNSGTKKSKRFQMLIKYLWTAIKVRFLKIC